MSNTQKKTIEFYTWQTPNGIKIAIILEELGLDYKTHWINILKDEQFAPDFLKISPNNKIPAIVDPDGPGGAPITVFESGAILLYLAKKFGQFYSEDPRRAVAIDQWLMWQMGGFGPMLGQAHHFRHYAPEKIQYGIDRYSKEAQRLYKVLNTQLSGKAYVAGDDYSIADMAIWPWASRYKFQGIDLKDFPEVHRWYDTLAERPAVKKAYEMKAPS